MSIIPNSFQTPNIYVDQLMPLLTDPEWRVLCYMTRRIIGFGKNTDRISLSQITNGIKSTKTGEQLDHGTGLSRTAAIKALNGLNSHGVIIEVSHHSKTKNLATEWGLQLDPQLIDMDAFIARRMLKTSKNRKRMAKVSPSPCDGPTPSPCDGPTPSPCDGPTPSPCDGHTETQLGNTEETQRERVDVATKETADQISPSLFAPILDDNPNYNTPADTTPKVSVSKPKKLRQQPTPHIDPRKFQNGYIPTGTGETAAEIWCERFKFLDRYKNRVLTVPLEEDIVKAATDLDLWRETVTAWDQAGYSPKNIKGMLDWYAGGGSSNRNKGSNNEYSNSNGNGQQPVHQWTGNLKNGSHNHILEQHIPDDVFDPVDW